MQANYDAFIRRVIARYEGGFCNDFGDPGGPTKFGITCYDLAEHMGRKMTSKAAWAPIVRAMSLATAEEIYRTKYAEKDRFNGLESGSDCVILDFGINSGVLRPVWFAQQITGRRRSNSFDDELLQAINDYSSSRFVERMCDEQMAYLRRLPIWPRFRGGWSTRVADLQRYCTALTANTPPPRGDDTIADHVPTVKNAQRQFNEFYRLRPPLEIDGFEGPKTQEIVRRFQREHGLDVDGVIGEETMTKLAELMLPGQGVYTLFEDEPPAAMARGIENVSDIALDYEHSHAS
jgi:lysozyme family protein